MLLVIGVVLLAAGIVITCVSSFGGLLFYFAWFLIRPQETWLGLGGDLPMERIFAICLILVTMLRYFILHRQPIALAPPLKAFAVLVFVNYLTIPTSIWRGNSLDIANDFGKFFLFCLCAFIIVDTPERFRLLLWTYVLCLSWEAAATVHNYFEHPYFAEGIQRAEGLTATWGDPDAEAFNLVLAIPLMLALRNATKKWIPTILIFLILGMAVTAVVLTGSRMGLLVLAIGLVMMAIRSPKRLILLPGLVVLSLLSWQLIPSQYQDRFMTIFTFAADPSGQLDTSQGESAYGRVVGFKVAMMMFADHPILGVGVGNFPDAWFTLGYSYNGQKGWHQPHNLPGQILSEQGLTGGIAFLAFVVILIRSNTKARRLLVNSKDPPPLFLSVAHMVPVIITCLLLQGFSSHCYYRYNWYLVCTMVGVMYQVAIKGLPESPQPDWTSPFAKLKPLVADFAKGNLVPLWKKQREVEEGMDQEVLDFDLSSAGSSSGNSIDYDPYEIRMSEASAEAIALPVSGADSPGTAKAKRRIFAEEYKERILEEAKVASSTRGAIRALLLREGLNYSHLASWRRARDRDGGETRTTQEPNPESGKDRLPE
jgi:O-antigen ligase